MVGSKAVTRASTAVQPKLESAQVLSASKALLDHIKSSAAEQTAKTGKKNILDDIGGEEGGAAGETPVWMTLTTKRHVFDSRRLQPARIAVPHPLNTDEESTICIITADPQRAYKNIVASDEFPAALRNRITRVIDLSHLQKKFKAYEVQRKLYAEHDIFLGDERIINRLPAILGKTFYKTTAKRPVPVVLAKGRSKGPDGKRTKAPKKKGPAAGKTASGSDERAEAVEKATAGARSPAQIGTEIQRAISSALLSLTPSTNTAVRVGSASWPAEHIAANVEAITEVLVSKHVPQGWSNVKGIFVKGPRTMALPVWQTDELWAEGKDVLADGSEAAKAIEAKRAAKKEKANIGKKRKSIGEGEDKAAAVAAAPEAGTFAADAEKAAGKGQKKAGKSAKEERPAKKAKAPASSDADLDKTIAEHKAKLRKLKTAAKKAVDV